jgi:NDP-sugar pyrophosphorylase family protein
MRRGLLPAGVLAEVAAATRITIPTKAVILAGGLATRLRQQVPDRPKCLVEVQGRPLIDHVLGNLADQGFSRVVLCTGVMANQVRAHMGDGSRYGLHVEYSPEEDPLGTAGAVYHAHRLLTEPFLLLNGDCLSQIDFPRLIDFFHERLADAVIALIQMPDISEYGHVEIGADGRVLAFLEKQPHHRPGHINAGAYVFRPEILWRYAGGEPPVSLERDVFPAMITEGRRLYGLPFDVPFIDIGTPERLAEAQAADWLS